MMAGFKLSDEKVVFLHFQVFSDEDYELSRLTTLNVNIVGRSRIYKRERLFAGHNQHSLLGVVV